MSDHFLTSGFRDNGYRARKTREALFDIGRHLLNTPKAACLWVISATSEKNELAELRSIAERLVYMGVTGLSLHTEGDPHIEVDVDGDIRTLHVQKLKRTADEIKGYIPTCWIYEEWIRERDPTKDEGLSTSWPAVPSEPPASSG